MLQQQGKLVKRVDVHVLTIVDATLVPCLSLCVSILSLSICPMCRAASVLSLLSPEGLLASSLDTTATATPVVVGMGGSKVSSSVALTILTGSKSERHTRTRGRGLVLLCWQKEKNENTTRRAEYQ